MYLRSIEMKGFKSFPERARLEFSPGVSVIVGPNGSGKSNITDAVLWALGEQSPGAVRGASMQDVISAGGEGVGRRRAAEVEVVIDNGEGRAASELSEIAISRRLDRSGEGTYRLNGARCRLVDVVEVLSDTNLGREMHSVISQGRVESIVHSKPRERRLLVEEAAGLGKHRKRRRRAELKLRAAGENLDRALDLEREARARLRPLKRQAQAAELGARIEREELGLRGRLVAEELRSGEDRARAAEQAAEQARAERAELERRLAEVSGRRREAEERFADRDRGVAAGGARPAHPGRRGRRGPGGGARAQARRGAGRGRRRPLRRRRGARQGPLRRPGGGARDGARRGAQRR
jgi:chromosome segregation protein